MIRPEEEICATYLAPDVNDDALEQALLEALNRSRFFWPDDDPVFFSAEKFERSYLNVQKDFMRRYGYRSKSEAYRNMNWCRARRSEGVISIIPRLRDKPEYWRSPPRDKTVAIPATTDPFAAGAALRLALDRCE